METSITWCSNDIRGGENSLVQFVSFEALDAIEHASTTHNFWLFIIRSMASVYTKMIHYLRGRGWARSQVRIISFYIELLAGSLATWFLICQIKILRFMVPEVYSKFRVLGGIYLSVKHC